MSPEERAEYDALMIEAGYDDNGQARPAEEIGERVHSLLRDAIQAHRGWADWVMDADARRGHLTRWNRWHKSRNVLLVSHRGELLNRAGAMGVRRRTRRGTSSYQQVLFDRMSWEEVRQVLATARQRIQSERITVDLASKLLELHLRAPDSRGPGEACEALGLNLDAYLADRAA